MRFDVHRPTTLAEARALAAANTGARYIAGGTDLLLRLKDGQFTVPALISLRRIDALRGIQVDDSSVTIGAATPISELLRSEEVRELLPVLVEACEELGSVQIRNAATLGGNLCNASPCADTALPSLVYDAHVTVLGAEGLRELPLHELFVGPRQTALAPGEVLVGLRFPRPAPGMTGAFLRHTRVAMDISIVSAAVLLQLDGDKCVRARVAAGSAAPVPLRLFQTSAALVGELTDERIAEARRLASQEVQPIDDLRAGARFRRHMAGVLVERAVTTAMARRTP